MEIRMELENYFILSQCILGTKIDNKRFGKYRIIHFILSSFIQWDRCGLSQWIMHLLFNGRYRIYACLKLGDVA